MPRPLLHITLLCCLLMAACSGAGEESGNATAEERPPKQIYLTFSGGPVGGTFNLYASRIASIVSNTCRNIDVTPQGSGGSADNLSALTSGRTDMGLVYSGDAYLALKARGGKPAPFLAAARLYGADAQLVVPARSGIRSLDDLRGLTVAVGNPGSGAALSAERFLTRLGLWKDLKVVTLGYSAASAKLLAGEVDAFWVLSSTSNPAVANAARKMPIRLLPLRAPAEAGGFFDTYPFYTPAEIPAHTYPGQDEPVPTFQDAALWCVRKDLAPATVVSSLEAVFSDEGLERLRTAHSSTREVSLSTGGTRLSVPLHPGAKSFWRERGYEYRDADGKP